MKRSHYTHRTGNIVRTEETRQNERVSRNTYKSKKRFHRRRSISDSTPFRKQSHPSSPPYLPHPRLHLPATTPQHTSRRIVGSLTSPLGHLPTSSWRMMTQLQTCFPKHQRPISGPWEPLRTLKGHRTVRSHVLPSPAPPVKRRFSQEKKKKRMLRPKTVLTAISTPQNEKTEQQRNNNDIDG